MADYYRCGRIPRTESEADTSGITLGADASDSKQQIHLPMEDYLPNVKEIAQNAMPSIVAITNQSKTSSSEVRNMNRTARAQAQVSSLVKVIQNF